LAGAAMTSLAIAEPFIASDPAVIVIRLLFKDFMVSAKSRGMVNFSSTLCALGIKLLALLIQSTSKIQGSWH
jgi:hypothetical protein